jgi:hypothetical protein
MKVNKKQAAKGAVNTLVAIVGGFAGAAIQNKILPADSNEYLKAGAPAGGALLLKMLMPKSSPMVDAFGSGLAGASGVAAYNMAVAKGVLGPGEEKQLLLDALTAVNESDEARMQRLLDSGSDAMNAAADFASSVAAGADFSSLIAGSQFAEDNSW